MSELIVLCGIDGSGKSTVAEVLKNMLDGIIVKPLSLSDKNKHVIDLIKENCLETQCREQLIGDYIFSVFLDNYYEIERLLREGETVICDRFIFSHIANQKAFGVNTEKYERVASCLHTTNTLYLDVDIDTAIRRIHRRNKDEGISNYDMLREIKSNFDELMKRTTHISINANEDILEVTENIYKKIRG